MLPIPLSHGKVQSVGMSNNSLASWLETEPFIDINEMSIHFVQRIISVMSFHSLADIIIYSLRCSATSVRREYNLQERFCPID